MLIEPKDLLLEDRLAPITTSMGFFETECADVVQHFLGWQEEIKKTGRFIKRITSRPVTGTLEQVLQALLPLKTNTATRYLFIPARNGWTAYFDNGFRGTDPTVIVHLPELMHSRSVWVVANPHQPGTSVNRSGWLIMEVYGHEKTEWLNLIRRIRLENDLGKWHFEQFGSPFPFEQTERYLAKKKTDRFDLPLLKQYLHALGGLSPFDENFFLPPDHRKAVLVKISTSQIVENKDIPFEEAKRLNGIDS
jgi:hypothetical protein